MLNRRQRALRQAPTEGAGMSQTFKRHRAAAALKLGLGITCLTSAPPSHAACDNCTSVRDASTPQATHRITSIDASNIKAASGIGVTASQGAQIQNSGTISGPTGLSVIDEATVTNSGTIAGSSGPGILARKSAGVTNTGTIRGTTGVSVLGGLATVTNGTTGTITGTRYSGIGAADGLTLDNRGVIQGTTGVSVTAAGASVKNAGSILASTGTAIASVGGTSIDNSKLVRGMTGVTVSNGVATLKNTGEIDGVRGAALVMNSGGTVTNGAGAVIRGGSAGIVSKTDETLTFSTTFDNSGSILSTSGAAISTEGRASIGNTGLVQGAQGITANGGFGMSNDGTVRGTNGPAIVVTGANDASITTTGTIAGSDGVAIRTDAGSDFLMLNGGTISGAVQQGPNYDYANVFGGQMDSLDGGSGYNTFVIQGGRVLGAVIDEDQVTVSGGRVGSIRMHGAQGTYFAMSGGIVDGDVAFGASNDSTILLGGGAINGRLDLGDGDNAANVYGTSIAKGITSGNGADVVTWTAGSIAGAVTLGAGPDTFSVQNQTLASTRALTLVDGGADTDELIFTKSQIDNLARLTNWEYIGLQGSQMTFDPNGLTLGDAATKTGTLNIDATSTVFAGGIGTTNVQTAVAGQRVTVNNAGTIDLTNGGTSTRDTFVINGNYNASSAGTSRLLLQTVLGTDDSPSDKLVLSQGTVSGSTQVGIVNVGGIGGLTTGSGILVVEAINGTKTATTAFSLSGPVEAGAYRYFLFKGGTTAGTGDNWYLRSSVPAVTPASTISAVAPTHASVVPSSSTIAAAAPTPIYRMEVPVYAAMPQIARELTVQQIGTFHERQGAQALLTDSGALSASWSRVWGGHDTLRSSGAADQRFSGGIGGVQIGQDLYADATASGHRNHYGFFVGFARASGEIDGLALGVPNSDAGHLSMNAYSAGAYWTHIGPGGGYTDAVVLGSALEADPSSGRGVGASTHGKAFAASFEAGLPLALTGAIGIEPQMQLMWQHATLKDFNDGVSTVSLDEASGLIGRLGVRLFGHFDAAGTTWEPYVRTDVWRYFGATDTATFAGADVIPTSVSATTVRVGAGIVAKVSARGSVFANMSYSINADGAHRSAIEGGAGVRWAW
jgi:outer membrane autotransporter protein